MRKIILVLLAVSSICCLVSCDSDSAVDDVKTPLKIMVDIDSYSQVNGGVMLRRVNKGVFTTFEEGDDFGLIVVDGSGNLVADNYRYVVQKSGLGYRVDNSGNVISSDIYSNNNYTYLAYSPYDSRYNGYTSLDSIIATHKRLLLSDYADQSTEEIYNKADLLVCEDAKPLGTTLRLSFSHAMGLLRIYYNDNYNNLTVDNPTTLSKMFHPSETESYRYICIPQTDMEVYGTAISELTDDEDAYEVHAYWQTKVNIKPNGSLYVTISTQPTVSYKTAGVDMGFPSGCIWADHNLGAETLADQNARGGKWYDAAGNVRYDLMNSENHARYDRGDYYSWGELATKYEKPALLFNDQGKIIKTGETYVDTKTVSPLLSGSKKGYYPETYVDREYSYANIDGNIAGTEYDVVRNKLWKGEWRIPNENEVDELMRNSYITVEDFYYEDNVRYAPWIDEKDGEGNYLNLHPDNSEFFGTPAVRPYRYLVTIFKFTSKINGNVLYFAGGTWSDWSIDMLSCNSRNHEGVITSTSKNRDYGGMYYFASSASHSDRSCSSYMELETQRTYDTNVDTVKTITPVIKTSTYVDHNGNTINLTGLTQNGHRYTGMFIRPVFGGRNWNTNTKSKKFIYISVEER